MLRKTGIQALCDQPWGAHICHLYSTPADLTEILVPYFAAGLEQNESCLWVTSDPLEKAEAEAALRQTGPQRDKGQIQFTSYREWYLDDGRFDALQIAEKWMFALHRALAQGYEGLRITGNLSWLDQTTWRDFAEYEKKINQSLRNCQMIAICSYPLEKFSGLDLLTAVENHQLTLTKENHSWKLLS